MTAWDWTALPAALAPDVDVLTADATTAGGLRTARAATSEAMGVRPVMLRVVTDPDDAPPLPAALSASVKASSQPAV